MNAITSSRFRIEKGVPIPLQQSRGGGRPPKYPLRDMAVGDSFFVPCEDGNRERIRNSINGCATSVRRTLPSLGIMTRSQPGGVRVWRIS